MPPPPLSVKTWPWGGVGGGGGGKRRGGGGGEVDGGMAGGGGVVAMYVTGLTKGAEQGPKA